VDNFRGELAFETLSAHSIEYPRTILVRECGDAADVFNTYGPNSHSLLGPDAGEARNPWGRDSSSMNSYDAIIIGTGQAGPSLAARLAAAGMRVAVIERGKFGGTCVNTGCTPTKTLVASAYAARVVQRAAEYGVSVTGSAPIDLSRVKARKDAVVEQSRSSLESWLTSLANVNLYRGHARFVAPRTVTVGAETLYGERVYIDVGGRPTVPGLHEVPDRSAQSGDYRRGHPRRRGG